MSTAGAEPLPGAAVLPRLRLLDVAKHFGPTRALDKVNLTIAPGEIHGLIGQNGSGKSTLVKLMAGYHQPERGSAMEVDGAAVPLPPGPRDLLTAGISFVHQDLGLLDHLSVAENICVGNYQASRVLRRISIDKQAALAKATLDRLGVALPPRALVGSLSPAERAFVAIARALLRQQPGRGVVLLDEATRALPAESLADVHRVLRRIAADGGAVLMVSHNLEEVLSVAHNVTVLRDGQVVGESTPTNRLDEATLARRMLGFELGTARSRTRPAMAAPRVVVSGLTGGAVTDVDLVVGPGEIVGLTGVPGAGYEDVPYLLAGTRRSVAGSLTIDGRRHDLTSASIRDLKKCGVALVPERRERDGLAMGMSVADNITLPRLSEKGRRTFAGIAWRAEEARSVIERLGVRPADPQLLARQLSGGNQQKVALGKWLQGSPQLLLLHEPTQGVDVGARTDILDALVAAAESGVSIVLASLEAADLAAICDRVVVFAGGAVVETVTTDRRDRIIDAIYAAQTTRSSQLEAAT